MKIALPHGWFARILLGGWALLLVGVVLTFLLTFLFPGPLARHLIGEVLILSILVILVTFGYAVVYAVNRALYRWRLWRRGELRHQISFVEWILSAGWLLFIAAALGSQLFLRVKWVVAFGPEVLLGLFCLVVVSTTIYGTYLLLRQAMRHLRRG